MKVRIEYTIEVSDWFREALNSYYGKSGLASREDVKRFYRQNGSLMEDDIAYEYQQKQKSELGGTT